MALMVGLVNQSRLPDCLFGSTSRLILVTIIQRNNNKPMRIILVYYALAVIEAYIIHFVLILLFLSLMRSACKKYCNFIQ